jgi:hypothetical protein
MPGDAHAPLVTAALGAAERRVARVRKHLGKGAVIARDEDQCVLQLASAVERGIELADPVIQLHDHVLVRVLRERCADEVGVGVAVVMGAAGSEVEKERLLAALGAFDEAHGVVGELLINAANGVVVDGEDGLRFLPGVTLDDRHHLGP